MFAYDLTKGLTGVGAQLVSCTLTVGTSTNTITFLEDVGTFNPLNKR